MVIRPDNAWKIAWDIFLFLLTIYSVASAFYVIGMNIPTTGTLESFNNFVTVMFAVDLLLSFNTAYIDGETGLFIMNRPAIAGHYLKFWFWIDFVATIPFDSIIDAVVSGSGSYLVAIRMIRFLRIMRIAKLYKLLADDGWISRLKINPQLMQLIVLLFQLAFIIHLFGCFWHYIALPSVNSDIGSSSINWIDKFGFSNAITSDRYLASIYFILVSMLTVGYGDIYPTNQLERGYAMLTMLVGVIFFSSLMSKVASLVDKVNPQAKLQDDRVEELKLFLSELSLPRQTKATIMESYLYYFANKTSLDEIEGEVVRPLLIDLIYDLHQKDIKKLYLFEKLNSRDFIFDLVSSWKPMQAVPGDTLYQKNDLITDLILVKAGRVRMAAVFHSIPKSTLGSSNGGSSTTSEKQPHGSSKLNRRKSTTIRLNAQGEILRNKMIILGGVSEGKYFGDLENLKSCPALVQYTVVSYCHLYAIPFHSLNSAIAKDELIGKKFQAYCQLRYAALQKVTKQIYTEATDLKPAKVALFNPLNPLVHLHYDAYCHPHIWYDGKLIDYTYANVIKQFVHYPKAGSSKIILDLDMEEEEEAQTIRCVIQVREFDSLPVDPDAARPPKRLAPTDIYVVDMSPEVLKEKYLFDPQGSIKLSWDIVLAVCIVISVLIIPIQIAFTYQAFPGIDILNYVIYVFFGLDMVMTFRTPVESKAHNALIISNRDIALNYLKTWFIIDLASTIPFPLLFGNQDLDPSTLVLFQLTKFFRLFSLFRLGKILKSLGKYESVLNISPVVMKLVVLFCKVFFVVHWMGCIWWGLTAVVSSNPWFTSTGSGGLVNGRLENTHVSAQYLMSIYYTFITMTTVGYGDIRPTNPAERLIGLGFILVCILMFSYMIANLTNAINGITSSKAAIADAKLSVSEYLKEKNCSSVVQDRILYYYEKKLKNKESYDVETITSRLPDSLRNIIYKAFYEKQFNKLLFFKFIKNSSLKIKIFSLLKPIYYENNCYILKEGEEKNKNLIFLMTGAAKIFKKQDSGNANVNPDASSSNVSGKFTSTTQTTLRKVKSGASVQFQALQDKNGKSKEHELLSETKRDMNDHSSTTVGGVGGAEGDERKPRRSSLFPRLTLPSAILPTDFEDAVYKELDDFFHARFYNKTEFPANKFPTFDYMDFKNHGYLFLGDLMSGEFIGYDCFLDHISTYSTSQVNSKSLVNSYSIRTCQDTACLFLERNDFIDILKHDPYLAFELQFSLAKAITIQIESNANNYLQHFNNYIVKELQSQHYSVTEHHHNQPSSPSSPIKKPRGKKTQFWNIFQQFQAYNKYLENELIPKALQKDNNFHFFNKTRREDLASEPLTFRVKGGAGNHKHRKSTHHSISSPRKTNYNNNNNTTTNNNHNHSNSSLGSPRNNNNSNTLRVRSYSLNDLDYHKSIVYHMNITIPSSPTKNKKNPETQKPTKPPVEQKGKSQFFRIPTKEDKDEVEDEVVSVNSEENNKNRLHQFEREAIEEDGDEDSDEEDKEHLFTFQRRQRSYSFPFYEFDKWEMHLAADHNVLVI
jgi:CRP-like cAMP-binding protein